MSLALSERLARYAELIVKVGANVAPGQDVQINSIVDNAPLARAVARAAYEAGARYVDVWYFDQHVRRARLDHAPLDSLSWTPPWLDARNEEIERVQGARIAIYGGLPDPHLLDGVDPERVGLDRMPRLAELAAHLARRRGQLGRRQLPEPGLGRTRSSASPTRIGCGRRSSTRCGSTSPIPSPPGPRTPRGSWRAATAITERGFQALHFRGPGHRPARRADRRPPLRGRRPHDLVGTASSSRTCRPRRSSRRPTGFATEGTVRCTTPVQVGGELVDGLELRFEGGRCVDVRATKGEAAISRLLDTDDERAHARRGRARRPGEPRRPARHRLRRHAARRERGVPHRPRRGLPGPDPGRERARRGGAPRARRQRLEHPPGRDDRRARGRRRRHRRRRLGDAGAARERLGRSSSDRRTPRPDALGVRQQRDHLRVRHAGRARPRRPPRFPPPAPTRARSGRRPRA